MKLKSKEENIMPSERVSDCKTCGKEFKYNIHTNSGKYYKNKVGGII